MNYEIINQRKKELGLNNAQIADMTGVTISTIDKITSGKNQNPKLDTLVSIAEVLGITLEAFKDRTYSMSDSQYVPSSAAIEFYKMYDCLDDHGKNVVDTVMRFEYDRCKAAPERIVRLCRFTSPSAAGAPNPAEGDYEYVDYPYNDATVRADFAVGIQGESMLPALEDGCTVFVSTEERISDGDIVIAWLEGEGMVCKRVMMDGERLKMLESINPDFDSYAGYDLQGVRIFGKVVGSDM